MNKSFFYIEILRPFFFKSLSALAFIFTLVSIFDLGGYAFSGESSQYSIHLMTLNTVEEAKAKAKEYKDMGYNAFYRQEKSSDKSATYSVYIERFKTKSEAEKEAKILKELDLIKTYEVRDISEKIKTPSVDDKQGTRENNKNVNTSEKVETIEKIKNNPFENKIEASNKLKSPVPVEIQGKGYYLKVSSLKEKANAEEIVMTLQNSGHHAFYNFENVKGKGDWYRVYLDGYQTKEEAESDAKKLMASGIISGYEIKRDIGQSQKEEAVQSEEKKLYYLHVASYKDGVRAEEDARRLTELGLKAFSKNEVISGEPWFRVYAGEFSDEKEASEKGAELVQKGIISYFKPISIDKMNE